MLGLIKLFYQFLSNLFNPSRLCVCRFEPSCSSYASKALDVHGPWNGSLLILRRLFKCHPWGAFGWDPVPLPQKAQR